MTLASIPAFDIGFNDEVVKVDEVARGFVLLLYKDGRCKVQFIDLKDDKRAIDLPFLVLVFNFQRPFL